MGGGGAHCAGERFPFGRRDPWDIDKIKSGEIAFRGFGAGTPRKIGCI